MLNHFIAKLGAISLMVGLAGCSGSTQSAPSGRAGDDAGDGATIFNGRDAASDASPADGRATSDGSGGSGATDGRAGADASMCTLDMDCVVPTTTPAGCAVGKCDPVRHVCTYAAKDSDGDGHATNKCKADDGTPIVVGDDCDDANPLINPGSWDGPTGDGHPDRCDGIDQDCDGVLDDGHLAMGQTCTCAPNDVRKCSEDAGGQPIRFPALDSGGNPLGAYCKLGKQTCTAEGQWGPCIGAVAPLPADLCDALDENCNGLIDLADTVPPVGQITYTFDGDLDNHAQSGASDAKQSGCPGAPPSKCPSYFKGTCNASMQWRTGTFPLDDCDDANPNAYPGAQEKCNGVDDDCNGTADDSAIDAKTWVFDWDGDGYGDINVRPEKSCTRPTTIPAACTQGLASVPSSYCTGSSIEGNAPACPPPPCAADMWINGVAATDCKDNPGQGGAAEGNKPELVHPGGIDLCNGLDYACQGTPDIGCGCAPVGSTKPCGDTQTCNAGMATCTQGGTWSACDGGDVRQRLDYCMDADGDGFCDLANCLSAACPDEAPPSAGWKQRSICNPISDCDDGDSTTFPASIETCNGDGKDHNCNKIVNTPGKGDCDCISSGPNKQTMVDCKPQVGYYPPGATPGDPSKGTAGYVQGSPLEGVCKWGTAVCNPTGSLGACTGATPGQPTEVCNADGNDYNCNGVVNTTMPGDCGCNNGDSQACGPCLLGTQTCINGTWGACSGDPGYQTYCADNDLDGYCLLTCNLSLCPNDLLVTAGKAKPMGGCQATADCNDNDGTVHPKATEFCGDGIDSNCTGGDNDPFTTLGQPCVVGDHGVCRRVGTLVCNSTKTDVQCSVTPGTPDNLVHTSPSTDPAIDQSLKSVVYNPNWDWNCNGADDTAFTLDHGQIRAAMCAGEFEDACNVLDSGGCGRLVFVNCDSSNGFFVEDAQACGRPYLFTLCISGLITPGVCSSSGHDSNNQLGCD